jgi:hypothetical protein
MALSGTSLISWQYLHEDRLAFLISCYNRSEFLGIHATIKLIIFLVHTGCVCLNRSYNNFPVTFKNLIKMDKTILCVVLYRYDIQVLTQREHGLKVSKNRVLRKIFGLKRKGVTGSWGK